eukprot:15326244-Ditylum_brightwellii.AAC.1
MAQDHLIAMLLLSGAASSPQQSASTSSVAQWDDPNLQNISTSPTPYIDYTNYDWNEVLHPPPHHLPHCNSPTSSHPPIPPTESISSTCPNIMSYSIEIFQKAVGFCNMELVLKHMQTVAQPTLCITDTGKDPVRDPGEMATLPKSNRNTSPIPCPKHFGNIFHYNIVYSASTAIG